VPRHQQSELRLNNPNATTYDDELLRGYRNYNWETSATIQRQVASGISVNFGYYRRDFGNFNVNDNQFVTPADYSPTASPRPWIQPARRRRQQICGLYDVNPTQFGQSKVLVRDRRHYGEQSRSTTASTSGRHTRLRTA
jgi:hypothetical protein